MDEQKESQQLIQSLKAENQSLKSKLIDPSRYKEWGTQDIITWILSLENGRYTKYKSKLEQSLNEEQVKGIHLESVDAIDVKGWGVVEFGDKKSLMKEIKALMKQNNNDNNVDIVADIEGVQSGGHFK